MTDHLSVPRYNFRRQFEEVGQGVFEDIQRAMLSGNYVLTKEVEEFERELASHTGTTFAVGVNTGTDALTLALLGLFVGPGDEVITVANTFHATALAIVRTGATPVLVDCLPDSFLMDPSAVEAAITDRTRAILPVHFCGKLADMDAILRVARRHRLAVVEDCCQSIGAIESGLRAGAIGTIGCFSFHPSKNLAAAGDAGAITTSDSALADRIRRLRHFGRDAKKEHTEPGFNSKLDAIQAIVLLHKLPLLDRWNQARAASAQAYRASLAGADVRFQLPGEPFSHVYHLFQIRVHDRDALLRHLQSRGIDAKVRYVKPLHLQPAFASLGYREGAFPVSESLARETLCLPIRPDLSSDEIDIVCSEIRQFQSRNRRSESRPPLPT